MSLEDHLDLQRRIAPPPMDHPAELPPGSRSPLRQVDRFAQTSSQQMNLAELSFEQIAERVVLVFRMIEALLGQSQRVRSQSQPSASNLKKVNVGCAGSWRIEGIDPR